MADTPLRGTYVPRADAAIAAFRLLGAEARDSLTVERSDLLRRLWSHQRSISGRVDATSATRLRYLNDSRQKARQYFPLGASARMTPERFVDALFDDSKRLSRASYRRYRSALLAIADAAVQGLKQQELVDQWKIAQARLILQVNPPFVDQRSASSKPPKRVKSIDAEDSSALIASLQKGRGNARKVAAFAIATLVTGARPGEWATVQMLFADSEAGLAYGADAAHFVLLLPTSKRKGDAVAHRALRIHRSLLAIFEEHIENFRMAQKKKPDATKNRCGCCLHQAHLNPIGGDLRIALAWRRKTTRDLVLVAQSGQS